MEIEIIFHPVRYKIIKLLDQNRFSRIELAEALDIASGTLSRHVKTLEEAGSLMTKIEFIVSRPQKKLYITLKGIQQLRSIN